ncbi:MAG: DMT family transporter [Treponema sp.]|nr:DMT family transporter [Treponema sp.]
MPVCYALLAAVFYALNMPCSKLLLDRASPTFMAAFLYLGAGIGVGTIALFPHAKESPSERLQKKDLPYTIAMVVLDIIAPVFLMTGLELGKAANATLLGNFEIVATAIIARICFKEKVNKSLWLAIFLITLSSIMLSFEGDDAFSFSLGSVFVICATICWGLENNCTRAISNKSTYQIVTVKGIGSGTGSLIIAILLGESFPALKTISLILLLGFIAYGLSIFTYIRAQKTLGAARTGAFYAIAPFIGSFLSFILLNEKLSAAYPIALMIMIAGTVIVLKNSLCKQDSYSARSSL